MKNPNCCLPTLILECQLTMLLLLLFASTSGYARAGKTRIHDETACQLYEMNLLCPGSDIINVQRASYGRQDDRTCIVERERMMNTHCSLGNAMDIVSSKCNGKSSCSIAVGDETFPDPCPGTGKYLNVIWECSTASQLSSVTCPGSLRSVTPDQTHVTSKERNAAWLRDPFQQTSKIYYMAWSKYDSSTLYEYSTTQSLVANHPSTFHHLPHRVDGTGFVVYDGSIYYNKERSRVIVKYDLGKGRVTAQMELPNANYHGTSPYAIEMATDIDMAVDEYGLWVIYATEANDGNIVISRLQRQTLNVLNTWRTSYEKLSALNAFITCGTLYVVNFDTLQIDYMYNTTSSVEKELKIPIPGLSDTTSAMEYNPKDRLLYIWDERTASTYEIQFEKILPPTTTTTTTTPTSTKAPSITKSTTKRPRPQPPVTPPSNTVDTISPSSSDPPHPPPNLRVCRGVEESGLRWPNTTFSQIAVLDCPGGGHGQAVWVCGGNASHPRWTTRYPDLSQCSSMWLKNLEQEIDVGKTSVVKLSEKLVKSLHAKRRDLTSWDIVAVIQLLERLLEESADDINSASSITDAVLKTTSELLHPEISHLWSPLGRTVQTKAALSLSNLLEEAAFFLAEDMMQNNQATPLPGSPGSDSVTWSESYATLAIRIEPVKKQTSNHRTATTARTSTIVTLNSGHGDSVTIDDQSLMNALRSLEGEKIAVVHLSFKGLGKHIVDDSGIGSLEYPVNSQVISLSVQSVDRDGKWNPARSMVDLDRPVVLNIQHNSQYFSNHACAFWNEAESSPGDGSWSRSGCRRMPGSNSTHSTCHCDHLTNFVVLSSDHPIPILGAERNGGEPPEKLAEYLRFVNVVRGGMIVSIVFLVVVAIILIKHSRSLDLNTVHKNLVISLLATQLTLVIGIDQVAILTVCRAIAAFLHYGVLCTFTWGALEAYHHLVALKDMGEKNHRWKFYYPIGYGLPAVVVIICLAVDMQSYSNGDVCWVNTNTDYIWAFIAPCCIAICLCVGIVAFTLYKLSKKKTRFTETIVLGNSRSDVASTCILMFLLCTTWSCGFLWLSGYQYQLTAWLFAAFAAAHGIGAFFLYCLLPERIDVGRFKCWRKSESDFPRRSSSGIRLMRNSSNQTTMVGDSTTTNSGYRYSGGRSGTSTTLIPSSGNQRCVFVRKAATLQDGNEVSPLVAHHTTSETLSHDLVTSNWVRMSNNEMRRSSFSSVDDTDPKLPPARIPANSNTATWNEYVHSSSRPSVGSARGGHHCPTNDCGCPSCRGQQYEEPNSGDFCACTTSTAYSCCYDHLHDDHLMRNVPAFKHRPSCPKCKRPPPHPAHPSSGRIPHHYETLGPFEDSEQPSVSENTDFQTCSNNYRHRYEDVGPDPTSLPVIDQYMVCHHESRLPSSNYPTNSLVGRKNTSICQNKSYGYCGCSHQSKVSSGTSKGEAAYYTTRNGRSSDPLSTDQGYDTDSQQLTQLVHRNSHSDGEGVHVAPRCGHVKAVSASKPHQVAKDSELHHERNSSLSAGSDCASENDREVEFINSASTSASPVAVKTVAGSKHSASGQSPPSIACGSRGNDGTLTAIDTVTGGNIGPAGSVNSWSAVMGSNPRSSYPSYGLGPSRKTKTTIDPQVILSQARQRQDIRNSVGSVGSVSTDENSPEKPAPGYNGYTLPGTAETGTKARIDLRAGGVNMITNL